MANKKEGTGKKVFGGIALGLVLILLGGVAGGLLQQHYKWGEEPKVEEPGGEEKPGDNSSGGGEVSTEAGVSHGIKLAAVKLASSEYEDDGVSPWAETAYTLTATITPSDATNKKVDWSIAFKNASSAWSSGKTVTDYVTVTPSADGALTAVVECKQAFGEQIAVKVTSRDNTSAQAEVTVDYVKRITDVSVTMKKNGSPAETVEFSAEGYTYTWECAAVCGTGTVDDTFTYSCTLMTAPSAILGVKANLTGLTADSISAGWSSTETSFVSSKENVLKILKYSGGTTGAMGIAQMNNVRNAFLKYQGELFLYRVTATGKYSNGAYQKSYSAGTSTFAVSVTDVNVNNGAIKF